MLKRSRNCLRQSVALLLIAACCVSGAVAAAQETEPSAPAEGDTPPAETTEGQPGAPTRQQTRSLPQLIEMKLPTAEELLRGQKLDWIVLDDSAEHVIVTEPVFPRPDTLNKMQAALDEKLKQRKNLQGEALERFREELEELSHIEVNMPNQVDETQYLLHMDKVSRFIHHEDLMLQRIDRLIELEQFELGYELLNVLRRNTPDWPGAAERHSQFLLAEAIRRIERGDLQSALATLEEAYERSSTFKGMTEATGTAVDRLVAEAVTHSDWRRARHFVNRLRNMYADHPVVQKWDADFANRAEQLLARAEQARAAGDHAEATTSAERAAMIWPRTRNLRTRHRIYADRYQRLHVGVLDLPTPGFGDPVLASRADRRSAQLQALRFFHVDHADDGSAHFASRFCDRWEPLNLGRQAVFELRGSRQPWEMQPIVTAPSVAARIARRLDPGDELYDERLAGYVRSVDVDSPYGFKINFGRVPVRTESLLTIPIEQDALPAGQPLVTESESPVSLETGTSVRGGFELIELSDAGAVYRRAMPEPDGLRLYHVAEIHEHKYPSFASVVQAVLRGDISMAPSLPARHIEQLRSDEELLKRLFVEKMALPQTHVIQLNPRSQPLRNREFRRALMYAIDRERILAETVLEQAPSDLGRVVTGPFPSESYANSALAIKREYDPVSAISLSLAARKQLGGTLPPLRMAVVDEPIARAAAQQVVDSWKQFSIEVTIIPPPSRLVDPDNPDAPVEWDLLYRTVQMVEPVVELWPFMTLTGRARVSDLDPFPDWLRQEFIKLDLMTDWTAAVQATKQLHRHLWAEVMVIPLWEVDEYLVYRKNIRSVPVSPVQIYDEIDRWVVEAYYPAEEP